MVVALLVATPAIFGQILINAKGRERLRQLGQFKDDAMRMIERFYASAETSTSAATAEFSAAEEAREVTETDSILEKSGGETDAVELEETGFVGFVEDDLIQDEMPLSESDSPFEAVEEGFVEPEETAVAVTMSGPEFEPEADSEKDREHEHRFKTPFTEPEINPIPQQTAGLLANGTA